MVIDKPILVVDDEVEMRIAMSAAIKKYGHPVELSHNAIDAFNKVKKNSYSMVITDMTMPKRSGLELLKDIKALDPSIPIVLVTAYGTIDTAISAMKHGAFDYIQKPFDFDTFIFLIERALSYKEDQILKLVKEKFVVKTKGTKRTGLSLKNRANYKEIITKNEGMTNLMKMAKSIAPSKASILIQAESGTGKELLAQYIHKNSDRADRPFIAINCAALPENLLESELFGHKKGAFTGAINDHRGKFEQANGGTLLLDEISEMPMALQAKLLRVLQEFTVDRVGGTETFSVDVRVIATTNRNIINSIDAGDFREDLYFRLNVIPLELPPLRERKDDIPVLADYFVHKHCEINHRKPLQIHSDVYNLLKSYNWRGNIRELENVIERAVLLTTGDTIMIPSLLMLATTKANQQGNEEITRTEENSTNDDPDILELRVGISLGESEKQLIFKTLNATDGNRTKAAEILGISIRTLRNKLNEYKEKGENLVADDKSPN
jgi:two-component system response regulator FlrC